MVTQKNIVRLNPPPAHSDKQRMIMQALVAPQVNEIWVACGSKFGKALNVLEKIPTVGGMKLMRDIAIGDHVFDEYGKPTSVLQVSPIFTDHKCYEVVFSNGHKMIADAGHLWAVESQVYRKNKARTPHTALKPQILTTDELRQNLTVKDGRPNWSINLCGEAQHSEQKLDIEPYLLGVWLGDGTSNTGTYTKPDKFIKEKIETLGYFVNKVKSSSDDNPLYRVDGLTEKLKANGLLRNKHIPEKYLYGSIEQRYELLRGLMDTDGTIDQRGNSCFDSTEKNLVEGVAQLCASLGIKTNRGERFGKIKGVAKKMCYRVWFTTDKKVFSLPRKSRRLKPSVSSKSYRIYINEINEVDSVPVKCITVDSDRGLFLASEQYIVTHNSLSASVALSSAAWTRKRAVYRWVAPIYTQSKIGFDYCQQILPSKEVRVNNSSMEIRIPNNETMIQFFHAQNPVSLEGYAINGYIFDEAAKMREETYSSAKTTTTVTRGPMVFISTPWGKNWFYRRCMEAREEMMRARHEDRMPTKLFITARTEDNPHVPRESIELARKSLSARLFRQFFLAEFEDDGGVFTGFRECINTDYIEVFGDFVQWYGNNAGQSKVVIGADWAKTVDYTVFVALDTTTRAVVGFMRFHKKPYTEAIKNLVRFSKSFGEVLCIYHDKTGVGMAIDDQLAYTSLPFTGIVFSNSSKSQMVTNLMTAFEQKQIFIPRWETLLSELDSFEVTTGAMGTMHYAAAQGGHDDTIAALMLANAALGYYGNIDFSVNFTDDKQAPLSDLERYYQDLED